MRILSCLLLVAACGAAQTDFRFHLEPVRGVEAWGHVNRVEHVARAAPGGVEIRSRRVKPPDPQKATLAEPEVILGEWTPWVLVKLQNRASTLLWTDLDADGSDELVAGGASGLAIIKRQPDGSWTTVRVDPAPVAQLFTQNLNGDGLPDIIAVDPETARHVHRNESHVSWKRHVIAEGYVNQTAIAADFTGDGRVDVIATDAQNARTMLYVGPDWKPVTLQTRTPAIHSEVMDVDRDGDLDYIGARYSPGLIFWLENPRDPVADRWPFREIDDSAAGGIDGVHGLIKGDLDLDGKPDLIANSGQPAGAFPNSLAWFRIPANPRKPWERYILAQGDAPGLSHYHGFGDVNGDGRPDVASAAKIEPDGNWFAWWEQPEDPRGPWKKHIISANEPGATNVLIADINGDGHNDFIASRGHGVGVVWFENPDWSPHQIDDRLIGPHSLAIGDIDGDGDIDAVTCAKDSHIVAWFENDGKGNFTTHHIHENQASYDIRLVDMDGDGDLDILNAGQESRNVVWFENLLKR